jgi:hypothetical protein
MKLFVLWAGTLCRTGHEMCCADVLHISPMSLQVCVKTPAISPSAAAAATRHGDELPLEIERLWSTLAANRRNIIPILDFLASLGTHMAYQVRHIVSNNLLQLCCSPCCSKSWVQGSCAHARVLLASAAAATWLGFD